MTEDQAKVYRLYALRVTQEAVETAMRERFSRIAPGYILIYTAGARPEGGMEIDGENVKRLTKADEDWIMSCATALLRDRLEKEKPKTMEHLSRMIDELSSALAEERRKQAGTAEDAENGDRDKRTE